MENGTEISRRVKSAMQIFEKYDSTIRATISSQVNNKLTADDIYQDFFLSLVHKPIPQYIQNVKSYIRRSLRNDVIDDAKKTNRYHKRNLKYAEQRYGFLKFEDPEDIAKQTEKVLN